jgi:hypothetical protein
LGGVDRYFSLADGSRTKITNLALGDGGSGSPIQPIEEQLGWFFGWRLDLWFSRPVFAQAIKDVGHRL